MRTIYHIPGIVREGEFGWVFTEFDTLGYTIEGSAACDLRCMEMSGEVQARFQEEGREIIARFPPLLTDMGVPEIPYHFVEGSFLLHGIQVPGNACDLSLDDSGVFGFISGWDATWSEITQGGSAPPFARYMFHNTGLYDQALAQRELFLHWANSASALLSVGR